MIDTILILLSHPFTLFLTLLCVATPIITFIYERPES